MRFGDERAARERLGHEVAAARLGGADRGNNGGGSGGAARERARRRLRHFFAPQGLADLPAHLPPHFALALGVMPELPMLDPPMVDPLMLDPPMLDPGVPCCIDPPDGIALVPPQGAPLVAACAGAAATSPLIATAAPRVSIDLFQVGILRVSLRVLPGAFYAVRPGAPRPALPPPPRYRAPVGMSVKGMSLSTRTSPGSPSTRSAMMLRMISSVPPAMRSAGA